VFVVVGFKGGSSTREKQFIPPLFIGSTSVCEALWWARMCACNNSTPITLNPYRYDSSFLKYANCMEEIPVPRRLAYIGSIALDL
jgi:hypothetical protein